MSEKENVLTRIDPKAVRRIHLLGVGGTGMGSFAGLLKAAGYAVSGSDSDLYPPMSEMLAAWGIDAMRPYRPENLDAARPDLVIVGNVIRRVNPEAAAMRERGLPHASFPLALGELFIEDRHGVVIAGTHGKTTTSALMSHLLTAAGRDPSFLVGGVSRNFDSNFRLGKGAHFVVEGDEYDTAYFDKGPKFLHYRPRTLILTSVELDHADIYRDLAHYESSFEKLIGIVPAEGFVAVSAAYPNAVAIARKGKARVQTYAARGEADWTVRGLALGPEGARFQVLHRGQALAELLLPVGGAHNVENALGAFAACTALGLSPAEVAAGMSSFRGVRRRQELVAEPRGVAVVDDFAHHPTAVRETIAAVCGRFPGRRLWALFEPRSNTSRRNLHQADYARSFGGAFRVLLSRPQKTDKVPEGEGLDCAALVQDIARAGPPASIHENVEEMVDIVSKEAKAGDVLLVMSNGAFGGIVPKLLKALG